jgi:hypothetical protein
MQVMMEKIGGGDDQKRRRGLDVSTDDVKVGVIGLEDDLLDEDNGVSFVFPSKDLRNVSGEYDGITFMDIWVIFWPTGVARTKTHGAEVIASWTRTNL